MSDTLTRWANTGTDGAMQEHPLGEFVLLADVRAREQAARLETLEEAARTAEQYADGSQSKVGHHWADQIAACIRALRASREQAVLPIGTEVQPFGTIVRYEPAYWIADAHDNLTEAYPAAVIEAHVRASREPQGEPQA